ncbi:MAG: TlpA family protein disulfide reductase [Burkholderiaceae bacterium]
MKLVRRLLLALLAAVLPLRAAHPADVGDRVVWSDVTLVDGRVLRAADLKGRAVVVEFWATWCPFCAAQNPHIQKLHAQQGGKGLVVLTFSIDKDPVPVRKYMAERDYTFAVAMAGPQSESWFGRRKALPEVYVVDAEGRIVFRELGEMFAEDVAALVRFAARR